MSPRFRAFDRLGRRFAALALASAFAACDGGITDPRAADPGRNPSALPPAVPVGAAATPTVAPPLTQVMADLLAGAFTFLPPLPVLATSGAFDAGLLGVLTVDVCEVGACGSTSIVAYTSSAGQGADVLRVDPLNELFIVNWDTDAFALSTASSYRIRVLALGLELGTVDVRVVKSGSELKDATGGSIALKDGRTLPVKFSITRNRLVAAWVLSAQGGTAADVAALLVGEFGSPAVETAGILAFAGHSPGDVAAVLRTTFSLSAGDAAGILASAGVATGAAETSATLAGGGYSIADVVGWLRSALGLDLTEAAATLYDAGIAAADAGPGLRTAFGASLEDAAGALHDAGYVVGDVAAWLLTEPDSPGSPAIIGLLRLAGYGLADVIGYLESTGVEGPEALSAALLGAGFTLDDVGDWLIDDGASAGAAAALLRGLGRSAGDVGDWLLGRGATVDEAVAALREAGFGAAETGDWLTDGPGRTLEEAGLLLAGAGHAIADVGDWLFGRFDAMGGQPLEKSTAILKKTGSAIDGIADWVLEKAGGLQQADLEKAAGVLHDVGYAWAETVGWLSDASRRIHNTEDEIIGGVAGAGGSAGWGAGDVAQWIADTYGRTFRDVTGFLAGAGYVVDDIGAALTGLGADASQIADALVARLGSSIQDVADLLRANGFDAGETFDAAYDAGRRVLSDPVDFALGVALAAVQGAGYFFDDFKDHLTGGLVEWTNDVLVDELGLSGYGLGDLVPFMIDVLGLTTQRVMEKAKAWGATLDDVVAGLLQAGAQLQDIVDQAVLVFNATVDHVTEIVVTTLTDLGASAEEIATQLVTQLGTSLDTVAALLKASGVDGTVVFEILYRINHDVIGDPVGFSLNVALAAMEGAGYFFDDFRSALFGGIKDWTDDELLDGLHLSGFGLADITQFAIGVMGLTTELLLQKVKSWGVPVDEVVTALKASGQQLADFADALMTTFPSLTEDAAAALFKAAGFAVDEVGDWLMARLASGGQVLEKVTNVLARAGYRFADVAAWVWDRSGHVIGAAVGALRFAGYTAHQVVDFFANDVHVVTRVIFGALKNAGYAAGDAASAVASVTGATMIEIGGWLHEFYSLSLAGTIDILHSIGATLNDMIRVLIDVYSGTLDDALALLVNYAYSVADIIAAFG